MSEQVNEPDAKPSETVVVCEPGQQPVRRDAAEPAGPATGHGTDEREEPGYGHGV